MSIFDIQQEGLQQEYLDSQLMLNGETPLEEQNNSMIHNSNFCDIPLNIDQYDFPQDIIYSLEINHFETQSFQQAEQTNIYYEIYQQQQTKINSFIISSLVDSNQDLNNSVYIPILDFEDFNPNYNSLRDIQVQSDQQINEDLTSNYSIDENISLMTIINEIIEYEIDDYESDIQNQIVQEANRILQVYLKSLDINKKGIKYKQITEQIRLIVKQVILIIQLGNLKQKNYSSSSGQVIFAKDQKQIYAIKVLSIYENNQKIIDSDKKQKQKIQNLFELKDIEDKQVDIDIIYIQLTKRNSINQQKQQPIVYRIKQIAQTDYLNTFYKKQLAQYYLNQRRSINKQKQQPIVNQIKQIDQTDYLNTFYKKQLAQYYLNQIIYILIIQIHLEYQYLNDKLYYKQERHINCIQV